MPLIDDYKKIGFSKGLISLWFGKMFLDFGGNIFALFFPILLYTHFESYNLMIAYFVLGSIFYFFAAPLGAKAMNVIGIKKSILISNIFRIPYFLAIYKFPEEPLLYAAIAVVSVTFMRSSFWLPFQTDSAKFSSKKNRGKQFSVIFSISSALAIVAPIIGGFILDTWDFGVLAIVSLCVSLLSTIPFYFLPETKEEVSWSYRETFKYFFHPFNRRMVVAYMSDGAVGVIGGVFWPLFIFSIFDEKFKALGLVSGGILLVGMVLRLVMGGLLDKFKKVKLVKIGTFLSSTAWLLKAAVVTTFHVFAVSIYHTLAMIVLRTSLDTLVYEKAADRGHYIDEYTLIKEMSIHLGRVLILLLIAGLLIFLPMQATFILASVATLFIILLK
ncbi:MFS transporter [Candidatus Parcubacteria bacterium]|jgi:MFS family permease|nr:MFS transporter [Candidatus Parcubacteria bacterium]MBT7227952.1 MFS transporter [Candidatus Parcubacteria bacterium]